MIKIKLDEFLEKALTNYDLPGLALGVRAFETEKDPANGQLYRGAVGFKDLESGEKLLPDHVFHMASVTKLFVGTSILQLWERGHLDLDGLLTDYLPWFEMKDERFRQVTIRHLMTHTAGMPDVKDYAWDRPETDEGALERYVRSPEVREASLLWNPGEGRFAYSNIGYEILGTVIASVSGDSFESYIKKHIFEPLEMKNSNLLSFERGIYRQGGVWDNDLCIPHEKDQEKRIIRGEHYPYNRAHGPSSTLTSNIIDMEKWALGHLEYRLLKKETYEKAWEKQALVPNNGEHICLSWFRREQNGHVLFGHEGNDDGFRASFWLCPEKSLSIMVCANISGAPVKKINKQVFDIICQEE